MAPLPAPGTSTQQQLTPGQLKSVGTGLSGQITNAPSNCLLSLPSVSLPVVGSIAGGTCLFTKTQARAIISALLIGAGGFAALVGAVLLGAGAVNSGPGRKAVGGALEAAGAVATVAGAPEAGIPLAGAGAGVRRSGTTKEAQRQVQRRGERQVTERKRAERRAQAQDRNDERTEKAANRPQRSTPETTRRRELERVPF